MNTRMYCRSSENMTIVVLVLLLQLIAVAQSVRTNYAEILAEERIGDRLKLIEPEVLLGNYDDHESTANGNPSCARDLALYRRAIDRKESWALKMLDASSKIPSGLLEGNLADMGMFDECMGVNSGSSSTGVVIQGRHCMYSISFSHPSLCMLPLNVSLSICVPSSCDKDDVVSFVTNRNNDTDERSRDGRIGMVSARCTNMKEEQTKDTGFFVSVAFFAVCIGFITLCTLCDFANRQFGVDVSRSLARFSMLRNAEAILSTERSETDFPAVHGLRVISTAWIVMLHAYFIPLFGINVNLLDLNKWLSSWSSVLPIAGIFSVDTFFTLSGFLMTYSFFKKMQKNEEFNIFFYYFHRFMRLTLPVIAVVASGFVVLSYPGTGAIYGNLEDIFFRGCRSKWWSVMLYTLNFVERDNYCLLHLWSLSVDMQLFFISPLILYPLYKRPKIGLGIVTLLLLASVIITSAIVGFNKYNAIYVTHEPNKEIILNSFRDVYMMPYTRASAWLIGIFLGYKVSCGNQKPSKTKIYLGWLLASLAFAFCIFSIRTITDVNYEYNPIWEMITAAIVRPLWAFGICWILYMCIHNSAGVISTLLSCKMFLPLSRISYCVYLVHLTFPFLRIAGMRTSVYFNNYSILHDYVGDMVLAFVFAFLFSLIFEVPMLSLADAIFKLKNKPRHDMKKIK